MSTECLETIEVTRKSWIMFGTGNAGCYCRNGGRLPQRLRSTQSIQSSHNTGCTLFMIVTSHSLILDERIVNMSILIARLTIASPSTFLLLDHNTGSSQIYHTQANALKTAPFRCTSLKTVIVESQRTCCASWTIVTVTVKMPVSSAIFCAQAVTTECGFIDAFCKGIIEIYTAFVKDSVQFHQERGKVERISRAKLELQVLSEIDEADIPISIKLSWYHTVSSPHEELFQLHCASPC